MAFTNEQQTAILEKLNPLLKSTCASCNSEHSFVLLEGVFTFHSVSGPDPKITRTTPCVGIACKVCGYVQYHNIYALKLSELLGIAPPGTIATPAVNSTPMEDKKNG
jgi:hypothetical protein